MTRAELFSRLSALSPWLRTQGVARMRLFGSYARNTAHEGSDIDLIAEFEPGRTPDFVRLIEIEDELAARLGQKVELTTPRGLHPLIARSALAEAVDVA